METSNTGSVSYTYLIGLLDFLITSFRVYCGIIASVHDNSHLCSSINLTIDNSHAFVLPAFRAISPSHMRTHMYFPRRYTSSANGESVTLANTPELETTEAYESIPGDAYETIPGDPIYAQIPERQKQVCYR